MKPIEYSDLEEWFGIIALIAYEDGGENEETFSFFESWASDIFDKATRYRCGERDGMIVGLCEAEYEGKVCSEKAGHDGPCV